MRITRWQLVLLFVIAGSAVANAQQPAGPPQPPQRRPPQGEGMRPDGPMGEMGGGPGMRVGGPPGGVPGDGLASMLLAHTGQLKLTDPQVTRLAAIARRTEDRHHAMREMMDSLMRTSRAQAGAAQSTPPRPMAEPSRAMLDRMRDQERADLRDALAVLSIEQQADAWMMRGEGGPAGNRRRMGPPGWRPGE